MRRNLLLVLNKYTKIYLKLIHSPYNFSFYMLAVLCMYACVCACVCVCILII